MISGKLGRYIILEKIGEGGMGEVYRAHDERLDRDVAVKVLPAGTFADESARRRFHQEALALAKLNHPNIAMVHDFDSQQGVDFLVLELVSGESLATKLSLGPLPEKEVIRLGQQVAEALDEAHQKGIIHRDLKPGNIRLTPRGEAKVLDFGLAKLFRPVGIDADTESLTAGQGAAGTLPYMAPEQLRGEVLDPRTDLWALGIVLYEMATGRRPFEQKLAATLSDAILHQSPPPPRRGSSQLHPEIERITLKCLEKDREDRYQSAREVAVDLRRLAASGVHPAGHSALPVGKTKLLKWAILGVLSVLLLLAAGLWLPRKPSAPVGAARIRSLVVLPLENLSGDPVQDYFSEAMTEELTNEMAALPALRVISRTSANRYRKTSMSLQEVARELGVDGAIEGSVLRSGDQIRITVQLIDGATDEHLWSKSYTRTANDIISLQREVAEAIAKEIHLKLTPEEQQHFGTAPTRNPQAYEAYLRANYRLESTFRSVEDVDAAIASAEQAIALDPAFAQAYVALARGCIGKIFAWQGGHEYDERAFLALGKALALNPGLAEAYQQRGGLYFTSLRNFDIAKAVADYRRAVSLNPNLAGAHHSLGSELTHVGLHEQAIEEFRVTLRLDPHFEGAKLRLARALWQSGRFDDALAQYERNNLVTFEKAVTLAYLGRQREAWEVVDSLTQQRHPTTHRGGGPDTGDVAAARAFLYAREGKRREAERAIQAAFRLGKDRDHFHHAAFLVAAAYAEMDKNKDAVAWLRRVADSGMPNYPLFRGNPSMQKLQGDPEYEQFLAQLKARWDQLVTNL